MEGKIYYVTVKDFMYFLKLNKLKMNTNNEIIVNNVNDLIINSDIMYLFDSLVALINFNNRRHTKINYKVIYKIYITFNKYNKIITIPISFIKLLGMYLYCPESTNIYINV